MPTLILTPRFTDDAQALWRAAMRLGWNIERLPSWRVPEALREVEEPVLYLEGLLGPMLAEQFGLQLIEPALDWLPTLPTQYRKREVELTTLGQARGLARPAFIKPPNDKSFPAQVYQPGELPAEFDDDVPVLVGDVVHWELEFRCFILHRQCKTFSIYLREGRLQRDQDFFASQKEQTQAREFLQEVLDDQTIALPEATVVDVGRIQDRGWAVVEQNAAWGSGIYGCDPKQVLHVLRHAAQPLPES